MAPKRRRRVVGTIVKTTRKVVEETLQVSVEDGEGNGEQNHSKVAQVVEVAVEEKKAQESRTSVPHLEDSQANEKAEEEETNKRKEESKEAPKQGAEEAPRRDEKQKKEGRGEDKEKPPKREKKQRNEGVAVEGEEKGKKRGRGRKRGVEGVGGGYKRYVFRVLKQVHPGMAVSSRAMAVLDGMMTDMFERLADEAARLSRYAGKATLSSREIQDAVRLVLPGELGKHAISEGTKAVSNYMSADHGT